MSASHLLHSSAGITDVCYSIWLLSGCCGPDLDPDVCMVSGLPAELSDKIVISR